MNNLNSKAKRIIENIYDVIACNDSHGMYFKQLQRDLKQNDLFVDKDRGVIEVFNRNGSKLLYRIKVERVSR